MLQDTLRQLSCHRAACKLWSIVVSIAVLLAGSFGRLDTAVLLWAAAPLVLLGLSEAGYAARQSYLRQATREVSENASAEPPPPSTMSTLWHYASAVGSLSIWPFYLALFGLVVAAAFNMPVRPVTPLTVSVANLPGNLPGTMSNQPYGPMTTGPMLPQYFPQRPPNVARTPFPPHAPFTPWPGNTPSGSLPPVAPGARPGFPQQAPSTPVATPPISSPESKK